MKPKKNKYSNCLERKVKFIKLVVIHGHYEMSAESSGLHRAQITSASDSVCVQEAMVMLNQERQRSGLF